MKSKLKNRIYKSPVFQRGFTKSEKNIFMKRFLTVLLLVISFSAFGQQDPLFSQYMFNKLLVNPAYAGSRENLSIDILDRYQWVGIEGAPNTITLAAHSLLESKKVGLGLYVFRDELGPTINQGIMGTYAYRIQTRRGWFSFGIQGGIKYFNFDWNAINTRDPDYMFYPQDVEKITPDVNLGIYYQTPKFFAGLSSKQLLENEYGVGESDGKTTFARLARHYYAMTGFAFPLNDKIIFRPSMLGKFVRNAPLQMDFNASFLFSDLFWVGASFRTEKAVVFLTEFRVTDFMRIGYSFDLYLNELQLHNKGSHEFRLGFDIATRKSRMKTPRYF
jgi:type IX secretion system PorP/SprF family membrane protein